jgi:DNA-binding NarL/FixJ family response regulator
MSAELSPSEVAPRELSPREREVLERAAFGRSNNQIAAELGVTINTVKFHLASIFRKLGVENRTAAATAFVRMAPRDEERLAP